MTIETPKSPSPRAKQTARGFTLLEILVAVAIAGLILVTVYGALSRTLFSKQVAEDRAELFASGREAILRMASEMEAALTPLSGDRNYFRGSVDGDIPTVEFITMNRGEYGLNRVRPGRILVVYTLRPLPNRRDAYMLVREEHDFQALLDEVDGITREPSEEEDENPAPPSVATQLLDCEDLPGEIDIPGNCTLVAGLTFRYYDDATGDFRQDWDSFQEGEMYSRLPSAVEIRLFLLDERGTMRDFTTIVDLPLALGQPTPNPDGSIGEEGEDGNDSADGGGEEAE